MSPEGLLFTKKKVHFKEGEVILKEQKEGNTMFFIDSGSVKIVKKIGDTEARLALLNQGDFFGEIALITAKKT